ncbi:LytR/AlgR family response regulator transcription factor [Piscinibacter sp.]|uniref:LytR/AlgR family response regulator transcription factor n=1 Tax=Piscinibacter sp. TaxID=1903157 RepID=UPI0039E2EDF4
MTTALIAEDETLLAEHLRAELTRLWPELRIAGIAPHGAAAVEMALAQRPDIAFLDIRMPGLSGLEAAQAIAEEWPQGGQPPLLVFVTAYDQYALQAFERAAVDYVLKPVQPERLAQTVARLREALRRRDSAGAGEAEATLARLRSLLGTPGLGAPAVAPARLAVIQAAGAGSTVHLVPVDEVIYFEAADKYVRVVTAEREHLIRTSLRELLPQLDPQRFWQVHRGTVVRCDAIASALRDDAGKLTLTLRGHPDRLGVSRLYAHRFKPM